METIWKKHVSRAATSYATLGLFLLSSSLAVAKQSAAENRANTTSETWSAKQKLLSHIKKIIQEEGFGDIAHLEEPRIMEMESATGDGAKTLLVDIGGVGASTDGVVVFRLDQRGLTLAKFKKRDGSVSTGDLFLSGASVTHSSDIAVIPSQRSITTTNVSRPVDSSPSCEEHTYRWNSSSQAFIEGPAKGQGSFRCRFDAAIAQ